MEENIVNVTKIIGSVYCVSTEDAELIYDIIEQEFNLDKVIEISFNDSKLVTTCFFNIAIFKLYGKFDKSFINAHLIISGLDKNDERLLPILERKAIRYFKDPEYYDKLAEELLKNDIWY